MRVHLRNIIKKVTITNKNVPINVFYITQYKQFVFYSGKIRVETHCTIDDLLCDEFKLLKPAVKDSDLVLQEMSLYIFLFIHIRIIV